MRSGSEPSRRSIAAAERAFWLLAVMHACSILGAGCAGLPPLPAYPHGRAELSPLGMSEDRPADDRLRLGDELVVQAGTVESPRPIVARVDARGEVHVASGSDVPVAGLSLERAEGRVTEEIRKRDKFAEVSLQVTNRASRFVSAMGAFGRPGFLELIRGMRVADLIAAAGGVLVPTEGTGESISDVADLDRAVLIRNGTALPISMRRALRGVPGHNVYVHPGDLLYVPFATDNVVSVLGQVHAPRLITHHSGLRLTEALSAAGGVTVGGDKSDIRVVRGPVDAPVVYRASLAAIAAGEQNDALLLPSDVLFVEDHPSEDVSEVFSLFVPFAGIGLLVATTLVITSR